LQVEDAWDLGKLDSVIKDLDNDGIYELVLKQHLTLFRGGAHPIAFWMAIYRWNQGKFVRADSDYPDFYRDLLPKIESEFERIHGKVLLSCDDDPPGKVDSELTSCLIDVRGLAVKTIERDKIYRHIGADSRAGYRQAIVWSKYADKVMRENAVIVFKDTADKKSLEQLRILSEDPEESISSMAQRALEELK
jgi:hypothetical protein